MHLTKLEVSNVRNLKLVSLKPHSNINIVCGDNGSGKTSLLEAIHLLSVGRSFRTHKVRRLLRDKEDKCTVFTELQKAETLIKVGISKGKTDTIIKVDGEKKSSVASLAELLPVQVITPESVVLLDGSAKTRRQYLDWGVFHVEHKFLDLWKRTQKALKQRNAILRTSIKSGKIDQSVLAVWNKELVVVAEEIDNYRQQYIERLIPLYKKVVKHFLPDIEPELRYYKGWPENDGYLQTLESDIHRDSRKGFTHFGPHRADIIITMDGVDVADILSRGQKKLLTCALKLAQAVLLEKDTDKRCLFLVDDLPSELDKTHRKKLCEALLKLESQVFISCIESAVLEKDFPDDQYVVFHVEHGNISAAQ